MSEDKKFDSEDELKDWLKRRGVDEDDVGAAAGNLFPSGFNRPSRLLGITVEELKNDAGIQNPLARELCNKLKEQQQRQRGPPDAEVEKLRKRVLALETQASRSVSFTDYYKEKMEQGRVISWSPPVQLIDDDTGLPMPLRGQPPQGGENEVVKPFWSMLLEENTLVPTFANGYEVGYL